MFICLSYAILRHINISECRYRIKISRVSTGATFLSYNGLLPQVLSLLDRRVCSSLGYLISQLLCRAQIPTLITHRFDKTLIQLLGQRH